MNATSNTTPTQDSPLLCLTAELRNEIFTLALPSSKNFAIEGYSIQAFRLKKLGSLTTHNIKSSHAYKSHFALTQVCRQIRAETLKLAYASNTFVLSVGPERLAEKFLETRAPEALVFINKVVVLGRECMFSRGQNCVAVVDVWAGTAYALKAGCFSCYEEAQKDVGLLVPDWTVSPKARILGLLDVWDDATVEDLEDSSEHIRI